MGENMVKKPPTFKNISKVLPHRISPPNLVCASVQAVTPRISVWIFYFQPVPRGTGGATSPSTLQCTQPKVDKPKSLLWWAKPLKTKLIYENKQRVAPFRQSGSRAILGGLPLGRSASWKRKKKLRLRSSGAAIKRTRSTQNIKQTSAILSCHGNAWRSACVHVSVWVTLLTISALGRSRVTHLHAFAARSRLITAHQIWSPASHTGLGRGTPFLKLIYLSGTLPALGALFALGSLRIVSVMNSNSAKSSSPFVCLK